MKYLIISLCALGSTNLWSQDAQIRKLIEKEFEYIRVMTKENGAFLEFEDDEKTSSRSKLGGRVIINTYQLKNLIKQLDIKYQVYIIRLVIAHELAHQIQYRHYGKENSQLLNECQADILAGYLLFLCLGEEYLQRRADTGKADLGPFVEKLLDPLNAIFELGDNYTRDHVHPRKEQRRTAFRDGVFYGNIWYLDAVINDPKTDKSLIPTLKTKLLDYQKLLDYRYPDNLVTWSQRRAKKILNQDTEACNNLIFFNEWEWDTTAANPYLTYRHVIRNIGKQPVSIEFNDQIYTVLRDDGNNSLYWAPRRSNMHSVTIQPGAKKDITDRLKWEATKVLMPRYITPGSKNSIFSCTMQRDKVKVMGLEIHQINYLQKTTLTNQSVYGVLLSERDRLETYRHGIGIAHSENQLDEIIYDSQLQVPHAKGTEIVYNADDQACKVKITLYDGKVKARAEEQVKQAIKDLTSELPSLQLSQPMQTSYGKTYYTLRLDQTEIGEIAINKFEKPADYIVTIEIFSENLN